MIQDNNPEALETYNFDVAKKDSIKSRLQRTFLLITTLTVLLMSLFSLAYFYGSTHREAVNLTRNKIQLADVFMEGKKTETLNFAVDIANDRAVQIGLDLGSADRISSYILELSELSPGYYVSVYDANGNLMADIGQAGSVLSGGRKQLSPAEQYIIAEAMKGRRVSDTISITDNLQKPYPAFVAAAPLMRGAVVTGVVVSRFVFADNFTFFSQLAKNLQVELAIYVDSEPMVSTADLGISVEKYNDVAVLKKGTEDISLAGQGLNQYRGIFSSTGEPVAVLHLYVSPVPYITVFVAAVLVYILIAIAIVLLVSWTVLRVSATILNPIDQLLQGVNIVRAGNLAHVISMAIKDEIGRLGAAFDELRAQLNEKIYTIEEMNRGLEKTVAERTATIETLNHKMKHYLSPQLYASIAGGDRDATTTKHYRKKLTIFFSDLVNFTATTESMEPEDLSNLLNTYLDNMARIAMKYGGTIDKYVGDAIMVFFGDPEFTNDKDHALRAVRMAMEMIIRLNELRIEWMDQGIERPFHVRCGINTGYCTVGNFGSETKMDYTIIGGNVNLAARYEAAAKPDSILMSHETYMLVHDEIECVEGSTLTLKGISEPVRSYVPIREKESQKDVNVVRLTPEHELVFKSTIVNPKDLNNEEKRKLLLNIKEAFNAIKEDPQE